MQARPIAGDERAAFDELARRAGDLFQQPDWVEGFGDDVLRCGIFEDDGTLAGGFHLRRQRTFGLRVARNLPFTPSIGPFLAGRASTSVSGAQEQRPALEAVAAFLRRSRFALVFVSLEPGMGDPLPFLWRGFKVSPAVTYRLGLDASTDVLSGLKKRQRTCVRKAQKDGLEARVGFEPEVMAALQRGALHTKDKIADSESLAAVLDYGRRTGRGFTVIVRSGEGVLGGAFIAHDSRVAYYLLGGRSAGEGSQAAGTLAVFEAIQEARRRGLAIFDFEGSIIPGIEQFVRGFGGELTPYYTVARAWLPIEMVLKLRWRQYF